MARLVSLTVPALLLRRTRETPGDIALRDKKLGIYVGYDWRDYLSIVEEVALGLREFGVASGDRVAIMGDPCPEWVFADMAIMGIGGITVGVYPTSAPSEVEFIIKDSGASLFIAETQEHLDKLLVSLDRLPQLRRIVVIDTRALFSFHHDRVTDYTQLREVGRARVTRNVGEFVHCVSAVRPEAPAAIVYTSGTTSSPKGAVLSHRNLIAGALSYINLNPEIREREYRSVAHLPLSHVVARVNVVTLPLLTRLIPFFCEEIDEFSATIREVAPNFVIMPPRFYEKFAAQLLVGIETSSWLKRRSYKIAESIGRRVLQCHRTSRRVSWQLGLAYWLARQLVFKQLLEKLGFAKAKVAFTGSAPMPPQVVDVWHLWGVDLRDVYGTTEACAISIAQFHPFPAPGDIGEKTALPGFECCLSADGEILLRSPMIFSGYWGRSDATDVTIDLDGWYHTGDVAEMTANGCMRLIDRLRDFIVTSGGKTLSPQQIEKTAKGSPFISEAVVFGHGRRYVTALVELDYTTVSEWARNRGIPYTSYTSLVSRPEVAKLIEREIEQANQHLSRVEQIKRFHIIPLELDPEQGETTPTRKIKRGLMYEMFKNLVEDMYEVADQKVIARSSNRLSVDH